MNVIVIIFLTVMSCVFQSLILVVLTDYHGQDGISTSKNPGFNSECRGWPSCMNFLVVFSPSGKCWNSNSSCAMIALLSILSNLLFVCHHWTLHHMSCCKCCWMYQQFLFVPKLLILFCFRSALQTLHKVSSKAREHNYFLGGLTHDWVSYYEQRIESDRSCLNEWHAMDNLESRRPPSPDSVRTK